jgi:hypothetical protein
MRPFSGGHDDALAAEVVDALVERVDPTLRNLLQKAAGLDYPIEDRQALMRQIAAFSDDAGDPATDLLGSLLSSQDMPIMSNGPVVTTLRGGRRCASGLN